MFAMFYLTAPTETPLNVSVDVETSRNITLSWERPSLEEQNGILTMYHVIIMETQILYLDNGTTITRMGNNFNRTYNVSEGRVQLVDTLHPSYNYTVRIAAATAAGIGPFSDPITVMTLEDGELYLAANTDGNFMDLSFFYKLFMTPLFNRLSPLKICKLFGVQLAFVEAFYWITKNLPY